MGKFTISQFVFHLAFWLLVGFGCYFYIEGKNTDAEQALILSLAVVPIIMAASYVITYWLIPYYLLAGKRFQFFLYLIYSLIASLYLSLALITAIFMTWANFEYDGLPAILSNQFGFFLFVHLIVLIFVGLNAIINWYSTQTALLSALQEKERAELKFLKSQLQPHFLFNTLNNLYYLSLLKSDMAPEAILKLSHLLDYVLRSSEQDLVSLKLEWEKLEDFIYLESLRYLDRLEINLHADKMPESFKIPPLCLISLAENCFKHGAMKLSGKVLIQINYWREANFHVFSFENTIPKNSIAGINKDGGIGLANCKKQLDYHFGNNYELNSTIEQGNFRLNLKIDVK